MARRSMTDRPSFIKHWRDVVEQDDASYPGSDELLSVGAPLGRATGLTRIGVHYERLPPGRRTSWPHAESDEEEFVFVVEGCPQVWLDGELFALYPGTAVGFPAGTGIAHTFINDSDDEVVLLVVGEASKPSNRIHYPLHPKRNAELGAGHWRDAPARDLGPHDGLPAAVRELRARAPDAPLAIDFMGRRHHFYADAVHSHGVHVRAEELQALARMPRLARLSLQTTDVTDDVLRFVGALTGLSSLDLSATEITDAGLVHLAPLAKLEHLRLKETRIGDQGIAWLAAHLPRLKTLQLRGTSITARALGELGRMTALEQVVLSGDALPVDAVARLREERPQCEIVT